MKSKRACVLVLLAVLVAAAPLPAQLSSREMQEEAARRLEAVEGQYNTGDYQSCRETLDSYIGEHKDKTFRFSHRQMARIYGLRALVTYAFRGEGESYKQGVREYLHAAVVEDPEVELGSPSQIPVFVQETLFEIRTEYLARFSRTSRRFQLGLLGAVVIDPTVVSDPSLLQPGVYFNYNLSERWSLISDLRLPLSLPIWKSIRGRVGLSWYPYFNITRLNPSIGMAYVFSLDNLEVYTHSIALSGQAERLTRMGLGAGVRVEVLRLDLILGLTGTEELPTYRSVQLFGESALRATFANMNFYIFYTF